MPQPLDLMPTLLQGLWVTVQVYLGAAVFVLVCGVVVGSMRSSRHRWLRWPAKGYILGFRGVPALVLLFWFYYVMPAIGLRLPALAAGILALGLNFGAYAAELVRGAIAAVPSGQTEAAIALNMTPMQRMIRVIGPQATLRALPPMGSLNIELMKNTALVFFIGLHDLTFQGRILQNDTQRTVQIFTLALAMYFVLALCIMAASRGLERVMGRGMQGGAR
ncbi:ectoine/hydroxyectoine ABC transporter permease subunit EhuC [Planctomycetales bacterium ZRK34]|nr:ectoine/hydroxyectoine ABC transporter permease subunit EhuC [Planctomycetales bacterium ZRK34]